MQSDFNSSAVAGEETASHEKTAASTHPKKLRDPNGKFVGMAKIMEHYKGRMKKLGINPVDMGGTVQGTYFKKSGTNRDFKTHVTFKKDGNNFYATLKGYGGDIEEHGSQGFEKVMQKLEEIAVK